MIEYRTYLSNGMVITKARFQDTPEIADVVVAGSKNAYSSDEYISREGNERSREQIQHVTEPKFYADLQERYKERMKNPQNAVVYIAWSRRGIEGVGSGDINKFGRHQLSSLYTRESGNGTGTVLLDEVNGWQQLQGATHSFLYVASYTPAVHFYERKGYKFCPVGEQVLRLDGTSIRLSPMRTTLPRRPGTCFFDRQQLL